MRSWIDLRKVSSRSCHLSSSCLPAAVTRSQAELTNEMIPLGTVIASKITSALVQAVTGPRIAQRIAGPVRFDRSTLIPRQQIVGYGELVSRGPTRAGPATLGSTAAARLLQGLPAPG